MTHPSPETIQTFLILGNVLSYNMNPGVSYILLGMTMRMAFSLGLQAETHQFSGSEQYLRRRVWWALAWQDSHFCMSYDRPSSSAFASTEIPYRRTSSPGHRSYAESMFRIIQLTQSIIRGRVTSPNSSMTWGMIQSYTEELAQIVADGSQHLRDRSYCVTKVQHFERLALKLHSSYITSELCRPALQATQSSAASHNTASGQNQSPLKLSRGSPEKPYSATSGDTVAQLRRECVTNLEQTIDAYLELHSISSLAARSWIGIQRAISAAFLLGILEESHQNHRIHSLLRSLEQVISERTKMEHTLFDSTGDLHSPTTASRSRNNSASGIVFGAQGGLASACMAAERLESPHWAKSMTKSLKALSKLNAALASPGGGAQTKMVLNGSTMNNLATSHPSNIANLVQGATRYVNSPNNAGVVMPVTPESNSSGEWTFGNMGERAAEFVQPALWG